MFRLTILCLCVSFIWASPSQRRPLKVFAGKSTAPRIVNGESASEGQFPWQAALFFDDGSGSGWFCGGSIISEEWILTAGHCASGARSCQAHTGTLNPRGGDITDSSDVIAHEGYDSSSLANDIGLVRLSSRLSFDQNTAAISLSSGQVGDGTSITVSGWGLTSDSATTISQSLNFVELVTISRSECEDYYGSIRNEMVCATSPTSQVKSTCSGDSGGPVVSNGQHVAIVSFVSTAGCESGAPSGYTRTQPYISWISQNTGVKF